MENIINIDHFAKVEMRAGKVLSAEIIEGSEKLLKLSVDFGEPTPRQVVSGIRKYFDTKEKVDNELVGSTCTFVTNLEPRSIMGLESQAMIMAFSGENNGESFFSVLKLPNNIPPGSLVH